MRRFLLPFAALAAGFARPSVAHPADAAYCARLGELVIRYVGKQIHGQNRPDSESQVAIDRCQHGDTAAGIPVLERKLRDDGFTLPPR